MVYLPSSDTQSAFESERQAFDRMANVIRGVGLKYVLSGVINERRTSRLDCRTKVELKQDEIETQMPGDDIDEPSRNRILSAVCIYWCVGELQINNTGDL